MLSRSLQLRLLKKIGATCLYAENGREAVDAVHALADTAASLVRQVVTAQLRVQMHEEPTAADADVRQLAAELPSIDLIIMDNQMPEMTGEKATRALRAMGYRGMIIGMTGDPIGSPDRSEFEAAGLDACADKDSKAIEYVHGVIRSFAVGGPNYGRCTPLPLPPSARPPHPPTLSFCGDSPPQLPQSGSQSGSARSFKTRVAPLGDASEPGGTSDSFSTRTLTASRRRMDPGSAQPAVLGPSQGLARDVAQLLGQMRTALRPGRLSSPSV